MMEEFDISRIFRCNNPDDFIELYHDFRRYDYNYGPPYSRNIYENAGLLCKTIDDFVYRYPMVSKVATAFKGVIYNDAPEKVRGGIYQEYERYLKRKN